MAGLDVAASDGAADRQWCAQIAYTDPAGVFPVIARSVLEHRIIRDVSWTPRVAGGGSGSGSSGSGGGSSAPGGITSGTFTLRELPVLWLPDSHETFRGTLTVEQWHRAPYAHVYLLTSETRDAYAAGPRAPLRAWIEDAAARGHEWLVLYLPGAGVVATRDAGAAARAYAKVEERLRGDMPSRRESPRVVRLDVAGGVGVDARAQWVELMGRLRGCVSATLGARCGAYGEEVRRRWMVREVPGWNFCGYFCVREALAFVYMHGQVPEEALRHYDELEKLFLSLRARDGDALPMGDAPLSVDAEHAANVLEMPAAPVRRRIYENTVQVMELKQYIFARQAQLLLRIGRVVDVALRSLAYVREALRDFERHGLGGSPAVHVWVFSVCVDLAEVCEEMFTNGPDHGLTKSVQPETAKMGLCAFGDLFVMARSRLDVIARAECEVRGDTPWLSDCAAAWYPSAHLARTARGWDDGDAGNDGPNAYRALTRAVRSRDALEALRAHVVAAAARHLRHAGRERAARALEADLVAAHVAGGRYADARALLQRGIGNEDASWSSLDVWSLTLSALCEAKLGEWSSLVTTLLALLQPALRDAACDALGALPVGGEPAAATVGGAAAAAAAAASSSARTGDAESKLADPSGASAVEGGEPRTAAAGPGGLFAPPPPPPRAAGLSAAATRELGLSRLCEFVGLLRSAATEHVATTILAPRGELFSSAVLLLHPLNVACAEGDGFEARVDVTSGLPGVMAVDDVIVEFEFVAEPPPRKAAAAATAVGSGGGGGIASAAAAATAAAAETVPTSGWSGGLVARLSGGFAAHCSAAGGGGATSDPPAPFRNDVSYFSGDVAWATCLGEESVGSSVGDVGTPLSPAPSGADCIVALSGPVVLHPGTRASVTARGVLRCAGRWALKSVTLCIGHLRIVDSAPLRLPPPPPPPAPPAAGKKKHASGPPPPPPPRPLGDGVMRVTTRADPAAVRVQVDAVGLVGQPRLLRIVVAAAAPGVVATGAMGVRLPPAWTFVGHGVATVVRAPAAAGSAPRVTTVAALEIRGGGVAFEVPPLSEGGVFEAMLEVSYTGAAAAAATSATGGDDAARMASRGRGTSGGLLAQRGPLPAIDFVVCYEAYIAMPGGVPRRRWACVRHVPPPARVQSALDTEAALITSEAGDCALTVRLMNVLSCSVRVLNATAVLLPEVDSGRGGGGGGSGSSSSSSSSGGASPHSAQLDTHCEGGCMLANTDSCCLVFRVPRDVAAVRHTRVRVGVTMLLLDAVANDIDAAWAGAPPTCTHVVDVSITQRIGSSELRLSVALVGCGDGACEVAAGSRSVLEFTLWRPVGVAKPLEFEAHVIESSAAGSSALVADGPVAASMRVGDRVKLRAVVHAPTDVPESGSFVALPAVRITEHGGVSWILLPENMLRYRVRP